MVEIKVPVGKQIRFHHTVGEKLNPYDIRVGETERYGRKRNWGRRNYEFEWDNNNFYDWEPDTDYYMTADGKLKQVGVPENEKPATTDSLKKDSLLKDYQRKLDSVEATGSEDADMQPEEITAKKKEIDGRLATPMPIPFIPTIF
jgi:hypothetical protein